ncbi:hypothetical protein D1BOALGB6SA_10548 [Olavius sp. associated proteobacterium Delta 1]|nr:hypothetical protein D1BOALGB6SA_10548 [Olavius sp. associated proteobacterium Delta 1]
MKIEYLWMSLCSVIFKFETIPLRALRLGEIFFHKMLKL